MNDDQNKQETEGLMSEESDQEEIITVRVIYKDRKHAVTLRGVIRELRSKAGKVERLVFAHYKPEADRPESRVLFFDPTGIRMIEQKANVFNQRGAVYPDEILIENNPA